MTIGKTEGSLRDVRLPAPGRIGAEVAGIDLRRIDAAEAEHCRQLVYEHKLVVFRGQELTPPEYIDVARKFGEPQIYFQANYHHPQHPEIFVSSNVPEDGKKIGVAGTGRYWHTDCQFFDEPLPLTFVYPQRIPAGSRGTFYIDMERVWRDLPDTLRQQLAHAVCRHEAKWRYKVQASDIDKSVTEILDEFGKLTPTVTHPAVIRHPVNGRELLYVSEGFTVGFEGLRHEESRALLTEVLAFIAREEHVHAQRWEPHDLLLWDNRQVLHMASTVAKGQPSVSYRIGVYDGLPFYTNR